jgi:hypothetical protein
MPQLEVQTYPASYQFHRDIPGKPGIEMVRSDRKSPGVVITDRKRPGRPVRSVTGVTDGTAQTGIEIL